MNLQKLFEMQAELDERIIQQHPELRGQNNLDWKLLALQVELGECANEWRGFKKWSNNQQPFTTVSCSACRGAGGHYNTYKDAICNAGYTHMMKHFEWVQVEVEEVDIA